MASSTDIDVLVSDNTAVDLTLFQYWLDGYSGKQLHTTLFDISQVYVTAGTNYLILLSQ